MKTHSKTDYVSAETHAHLTSGEVIRMLRELKGWTQAELAKRSEMTTANVRQLEDDKVELGKHSTEQLAKAFGVHPATIMFPEYESLEFSKAA